METDSTIQMKQQLDKLGFVFSEQQVASFIAITNKNGSFQYGQIALNGKDKLTMMIDFALKEGKATVVGCNGTLNRVPPIKHGSYDGVDTKDLEARMNTISWEIQGQNLKMLPDIYGDILTLEQSNDRDALEISHSLQAKYWSGTDVEKYIKLSCPEQKFVTSFYFPTENNITDIAVKEAYNLLCGRGVFKFHSKPETPNTIYAHWKVIDGGILKEFPNYNFVSQLRKLPIIEIHLPETAPELVQRLYDGSQQLIHLELKKQRFEALIETDPRKKSLNLYNAEGHLLDIPALKNDGVLKLLEHAQRPSDHLRSPSIKQQRNKNKGRSI